MATGDILGWLNSDDMHLPSTLSFVADKVDLTDPGIYFGDCIHFFEDEDKLVSWGSDVTHRSRDCSLTNVDFIIQPSAFWSRKTWELVGPLRADLHYGFDWEWFLRAARRGAELRPINKALSLYRTHASRKTATGGRSRQLELLSIYREYDERIARLYEMLMDREPADVHSRTAMAARAAGKFLSMLGIPCREHDLTKFFNRKKYKDFSAKEIGECLEML